MSRTFISSSRLVIVTQIQVSFKITLSDQIPTKISSNHSGLRVRYAPSSTPIQMNWMVLKMSYKIPSYGAGQPISRGVLNGQPSRFYSRSTCSEWNWWCIQCENSFACLLTQNRKHSTPLNKLHYQKFNVQIPLSASVDFVRSWNF